MKRGWGSTGRAIAVVCTAVMLLALSAVTVSAAAAQKGDKPGEATSER